MKVLIEPQKALYDEKLNIIISDLLPYEKVEIKAFTIYPWAKQERFESNAWFYADENGVLDLSTQKPEEGDYDYINSMGLVSSLRTTEQKEKDYIPKVGLDEPLLIDFTIKCEEGIVKQTVERIFKNDYVVTQEINEEFIGTLFYTPEKNNKTIIVLGGWGGGINYSLPISSCLASHGFNVLALEYYDNASTLNDLKKVPLEYYEKAINWLKDSLKIKSDEIIVVGKCKGGELALLLASKFSIINKVIAYVPNYYCFQGSSSKASSWTYKDKEIPFIKFKKSYQIKNAISSFIKNEEHGYNYAYKRSLEVAKNKEEARIKIENIRGDILLITGEKDNVWNSYEACESMINDLKKLSFAYNYKLITYKNVGHDFYAPYLFPVNLYKNNLGERLNFPFEETKEGIAIAQEDSWVKTIEFLKS